MFLAVPTTSSPFFFFRKLLCLLAGLCLAFVANVAVTNSAGLQAEAGLRLELPANGNLRVENLRGGVIAELWSENYVSVSAITDSGQASRSPAIMQRTDSLLSMRVPRGAAGAARINLKLKIPARAHVAIVTSESSVQVRARLGAGGRSVRLYSQAGNIALATAGTESPTVISNTTAAERREPLEPA